MLRLGLLIVLMSIMNFSSIAQTKLKILHADILKPGGEGVQILEGNVALQQGATRIYCQKATYRKITHKLSADGGVKVDQAGTIITGNRLTYDNESRIGKFHGNVKLVDEDMTLTTNDLEFNSKDNSGHYTHGGTVQDSGMVLVSQVGHYYPDRKTYQFTRHVKVTTDDYLMFTDTLNYNKATDLITFSGPSRIINQSDSSFIYCQAGWFNNATDEAFFRKRAYYKTREQLLEADTIYYDRSKAIAKAISHVILTDTIEGIIIKGNHSIYYQEEKRGFVTDSALFIQLGENDSLYLHADTLFSSYDSSGEYRQVVAYYRAKIFRRDLQGQCDSVFYSTKDSVMQLYGQPVLWANDNQITADYIEIHTKNNQPDYVDLFQSAFIASKLDSQHYNQIKGHDMTGYFKDKQLKQINVHAEAQSLYFAEEQEQIVGINKAQSAKMNIYLNNRQIDRILFLSSPSGTLYPLNQPPPEGLFLEGFKWLGEHRPRSVNDLFRWIEENPSAEDKQIQ